MTRRVGARRPVCALAAGLIGLVMVLLWQTPSWAHAELLSTNPADGQVVPVAPQQVRLTFNEPVQIRPGGVRLLTAAGADTQASSHAVDAVVSLDVPPGVANGTYIVTWRVISADGHPVAGGFSFSIGAPTPGAVAVPPAASSGGGLRMVRLVTEAAGYLGTLAAAGLVVFVVFFAPRRARALHQRIRRLMFGLAGLAVVAAIVSIPISAAWQDAATPSALFTSGVWRAGDQWLVTALVAAGLGFGLAGIVGLKARPGDRLLSALACGGAALAAGAFALAGHTRTFGPTWLVLTADLAHVAAAAVWLGGIAGLILALADKELTPGAAAASVSRFSFAAAGVVGILAIAGVLLGWRILGSWQALFGTGYGWTLLVKVGIAAGIVAVAALNRYRLLPMVRAGQADSTQAAGWRLLRRTVSAEAVLLVSVLAVTGLLVTQSPNIPKGQPAAAAEAGALHAALGQGRATLSITPGGLGINSLSLSLHDSSGAAVEPVETPAMRVTLPARDVGPLTRELSRVGPGRYEAVSDFPLSGSWKVEVSVRLSTFDNPVAIFIVDIP
jgi:copper transport protein